MEKKLKHLLKHFFLTIIFDKIILQHKLNEFSKNLVKDFEDRFSRMFSAHAGCCSSLKEKKMKQMDTLDRKNIQLLVIMNFHSSWLHILQQELIVS